jgi:hypothetical protein
LFNVRADIKVSQGHKIKIEIYSLFNGSFWTIGKMAIEDNYVNFE